MTILMEFDDDLKKIWQQAAPPEPAAAHPVDREKLRKTGRTTDRLLKMVWLEGGLVFGTLGLLGWAWFAGMIYNSRLVGWLLVLSVGVSIPVFWRLWRSIRGLSEVDFSKNVVENLRLGITRVRRELRFYLLSFWIFSGLMSLLVLAEPFVFWKKAFVLGFLLVNALTGKHWLRWLYGKKLDALERQLAAFEG